MKLTRRKLTRIGAEHFQIHEKLTRINIGKINSINIKGMNKQFFCKGLNSGI